MIKKTSSNKIRQKRHLKIRQNIFGTMQRPRLVVFRSNTALYAQVIDDTKGHTLVSADFKEANLVGLNIKNAKALGLFLGTKALKEGIKSVVFDRGGYLYTGRVKGFAQGAREAGLDF